MIDNAFKGFSCEEEKRMKKLFINANLNKSMWLIVLSMDLNSLMNSYYEING